MSGGAVYKIAIQSDGKIVAVGTTDGTDGRLSAIIRFNSDGSLDTTFGNSGMVVRSDLYPLYGLTLQSDGKLVLAGKNGVAGVDGIWTVSRLDTSGNLDLSFGGTGTVQVFPTGRVTSVLAQPNGKLVLVGTDQENTFKDFVTIRLNSDGTLDSTFGAGAAPLSAPPVALSKSGQASTATLRATFVDGSARQALDAAAVQQLLAEPDGKNTWTRKSRTRIFV